MYRRLSWPARALLVLLLAGCNPVIAQDTPSLIAPAKSGPEAIAPAEIPSRADADDRFAQEVIERTRHPGPSYQFAPRLDELTVSVREQIKLFKDNELGMQPVARLESLERHWRFFGKQLDHWRADLKRAADPYAEDAAELGKRRANWEATGAAADSVSLAPALSDRAASVQAQLSLAERAISEPLEKQIRLGRRANALEADIRAGQKAVVAAIAYNDSRLTRMDAPPLWELGKQPVATSALDSLKTGVLIETKFLVTYASANQLTRRVHNLLSLALLPFLIWLSFRTRKLDSGDPELQASSRVLRRPLSSWLLLLMMGVLIIEPDAPILLHQIALVLALVPVLRLLPPRVYAVLGAWPVMASVLYLLNLVSFLFTGNEVYYRYYILSITALALALTLWLLWRGHRGNGAESATLAGKVVRNAEWVGVAILVVSAVSNILGNVSLSEMLTDALLLSSYLGLVSYAGVNVLESVLRLMIARPVLVKFRIVAQHGARLMQSFTRLVRLLAFAGWLLVTMNEFRIYRPIRDALAAVLAHPLTFGQISLTLGNVAMFLLSVFLAFWIAKTIRIILRDEVLANMSLPRGVANSVSSLSYYALVLLGLLVSLAAAGFQIGQLAIVIGALGVGIGLGLQHVVDNFVSGLILMFERPIRPGDVIDVSGTTGTVREIGMRATTLATFDGADVVVPNGTLLSEKVTNWTLSNMSRRIEVDLGVGYGSDPRQVLALLMQVAQSTPGIATEPEPVILFNGFGASSMDFGIRAWSHQYGDWVNVRSDLNLRLHEALKVAGIDIPFPQQDLHLRSISAQVSAALVRPPEIPAR